MFKLLCSVQSILVALVLLQISAAYSQPKPKELISSVLDIDAKSSCYMRHSDGTIIDLSGICEISPGENPSNSSQLINTRQNAEVDIFSPEYRRSMEILRQQRQALPDRETLIREICQSWGRCPTPAELQMMSVGGG